MQFLYRKNGGQVILASTNELTETAYFGVAEDPELPDGASLSPPKIYDDGAVRNATSEELETFETAAAEDAVAEREQQATALLVAADDPLVLLVRAVVAVFLQEINTLRQADAIGLPAISANAARTAILNRVKDLLK